MSDRKTVITHLQIIHTWAKFARERDLQFFTPKHLENIAEWTDDALTMLKEQEPMTPEEFKDGLLKMFSSIWECEINHPMFQDTVGELMSGVIQLYKEAVKWNEQTI